jgi:bifunctional DNA-binding transcriptional regulator/antitoxin component of YhaV-PrlF toxin-antitoxin module
MSKKSTNNVRYEVITQEDASGDLLIPIPLPLLERLGWKEGMEIDFEIDKNGQIILKRHT